MARSLAGPPSRACGCWTSRRPAWTGRPARRLVTSLSPIIDGVTAIIATHDPPATVLAQADGSNYATAVFRDPPA